MKRPLCMVGQCRYVAERAFEDFLVCVLHDHPAVLRIIEELRFPCAYLSGGLPIVMPCGPLEAEHFAPREAEGLIGALECPWLATIDGPNKHAHPDYDLTRPH